MTRLPADEPSLIVRAVDVRTEYTTFHCPKCGPVEDTVRIGMTLLCSECGHRVSVVIGRDPHKGQ